MQSWYRHFTETAGQDCMGFGNIAWLAENFTFLHSVQPKVWLVAGKSAELLITFFFFDIKDLIYTYVKSVTRCCSNDIPWIAWICSCEMLLWTFKKTFMAPFYGWGSTASRLEPIRGASLPFTTKSPETPGTHFINNRRMKGWVNLGATQWFWTRDPWIGNPAP